MVQEMLNKMNGFKGILLTTLVAIALGLGGWNLLTTFTHAKDITKLDTSFKDHKEMAEKRDERVEKKFDAIIKKLDEVNCFILERKAIDKLKKEGLVNDTQKK